MYHDGMDWLYVQSVYYWYLFIFIWTLWVNRCETRSPPCTDFALRSALWQKAFLAQFLLIGIILKYTKIFGLTWMMLMAEMGNTFYPISLWNCENTSKPRRKRRPAFAPVDHFRRSWRKQKSYIVLCSRVLFCNMVPQLQWGPGSDRTTGAPSKPAKPLVTWWWYWLCSQYSHKNWHIP